MGDSPLSIAANIAGLLTFAVAILASIYVRIVVLRNAEVEMERIRKSSEGNVEDLGLTNTETSAPNRRESYKHLCVQEDDEPKVVRLKNLSVLLIATDIVIYVYCIRAVDIDGARRRCLIENVQAFIDDTANRSPNFVAMIEEVISATKRSIIDSDVITFAGHRSARWLSAKKLVNALQKMMKAGSSTTLIRWFGVREIVLEKLRQRDILSARVLSLQASIAKS